LFALARGYEERKAARLASAVAAMNARWLGARAGLPSLAEAEAFLADHPA
jgi:sugar/nucleoside kinase (ribokinase family)